MKMISLNYILLGGQFLLLLTVILLQCLEGIHSQNSTTAETQASSTGQQTATVPFSEQPSEVIKYDIPMENATQTETYEYKPPSPVVLCSYL